jgi:hypothetical protein
MIPLLVLLGQVADGLAYRLAIGHGTELGPLGALDPGLVLVVKMLAGAVLAIGVYALRRPTLGLWLATAGFFGALTEVLAVA